MSGACRRRRKRKFEALRQKLDLEKRERRTGETNSERLASDYQNPDRQNLNKLEVATAENTSLRPAGDKNAAGIATSSTDTRLLQPVAEYDPLNEFWPLHLLPADFDELLRINGCLTMYQLGVVKVYEMLDSDDPKVCMVGFNLVFRMKEANVRKLDILRRLNG